MTPSPPPSREELLQMLERRAHTQSSKKALLNTVTNNHTTLFADIFQRFNSVWQISLPGFTSLNIGFATCICLCAVVLAVVAVRVNILPSPALHQATILAIPSPQASASMTFTIPSPRAVSLTKQQVVITRRTLERLRKTSLEALPNLAFEQKQVEIKKEEIAEEEAFESENMLSPTYDFPRPRIGAEPWTTIQGLQFDFTRPTQERTAQFRGDALCVNCPSRVDPMTPPELLYGMDPASIFRF